MPCTAEMVNTFVAFPCAAAAILDMHPAVAGLAGGTAVEPAMGSGMAVLVIVSMN